MADDAISNGLKLELKPESNGYQNGDMPRLVATISNVSNQNVAFCTYLLEHRLLSTLRGGPFDCYPFGTTPRPERTAADYKVLTPGQKVDISLHCGPGTPYAFFPAAKQPRILSLEDSMPGFPSGTYKFYVYLSPHVAFYTSPEGLYNRSREVKHVVKDVPGASYDQGPVWDGDMTATADVTFA